MENCIVDGRLTTDAEVENYLNSFPTGYRFCPTNEELVVYYLRNKVFNLPLPPNRIRDVNIYKCSPDGLSDKYGAPRGEKMYFFTPRDRKYAKGSRRNRVAVNGYWKASGSDKPVGREANPIGYTKSLVFYRGEHNKAVKTNWMMHEFTLNIERSSSENRAPDDTKLDDCVLCQVYKIRKREDNEDSTLSSPTTVEGMIVQAESPLMHTAPNRIVPERPPMPHPDAMCYINSQQQLDFQEQNSFLLPTTMAHPAAAAAYQGSYDPGHYSYDQNHNSYPNQALPGDQMMNVIRDYNRPTPQPYSNSWLEEKNYDFSSYNIY